MSSNVPPALPEPDDQSGGPPPGKARAAGRDGARLRPRRDLAEHQPRLRRRLARLSALARPPGPRLEAARRPGMRRPLPRRARVRRQGRRRPAAHGRHHRAAAVRARLEFLPAGPALRPQGPPRRDRARRRAPDPRPAAGPEGGAAAGACRRHARRPAPFQSQKHP